MRQATRQQARATPHRHQSAQANYGYALSAHLPVSHIAAARPYYETHGHRYLDQFLSLLFQVNY